MYFRNSIIFIIVLSVIRLWLAGRFQLIADEAYYWVWSRHLDYGYYSKGPGVAWTIAAGTWIFGDTLLGIRFFSVLFSAGTSFLIFRLGSRLFSERVGFWSMIAASSVPIFAIEGLLMTIDPLSIFFWTLSMWLFLRALDHGGLLNWAATGASIGLGMLCKYTNVALLFSFALFCLWTKPKNFSWRTSHFWIMSLTAILCLAPVAFWNHAHGWVTLKHLFQNGSLDQSFQPSLLELGKFLGGQILVFFPGYFVILLVALRERKAFQSFTDSFKYLVCLFMPLFIFYCLISFNKRGEANWTAPSFISGIILVIAYGLIRTESSPKWKFLMPLNVGCAGLLVMLMHVVVYSPIGGFDPFKRRVRGWKQFAENVTSLKDQYQCKSIIANDYPLASLLAFYLPGHPQTFVSRSITNQFSFWEPYPTLSDGGSALYVSPTNSIPVDIFQHFKRVELISEDYSKENGRNIRKFYFFLCENVSPGSERLAAGQENSTSTGDQISTFSSRTQ